MKLTVALLLLFTIATECWSNPVVQTKNGLVKGFTVREQNKSISVFSGIPFAQPPLGALRFKPPKPANSWNGTYDATKNKPFCTQPRNKHSSEDCLYLKVWTPSTSGNRSVVVWIHGGGYIYGSGFEAGYDSTALSALGDVVVVNINYRLNILGFFYDGTDQAPGNMGLRDMILALKWVKNNIRSFGGDPDSVTIVGHSAGAMAVGSLMLVTKHGNLFKRAIIISGTPNSFYGTRSRDKLTQYSKKIATEFRCYDLIKKKINMDCMRKTNAHHLADRAGVLQLELILFTPIYGDVLMPVKPAKALETGQFRQNVDLIFGTTVDEFTTDLKDRMPLMRKKDLNVREARGMIDLIFGYTRFPSNQIKKVADFYTKGLTDKDSDKLRKAVADSMNDYELVCPSVLFGSFYQKWNQANRAFAYAYNYTVSGKQWPGARHGEDLHYFFGRPIQHPTKHNTKQVQVSRDMINSWMTFVKTGVPGRFPGKIALNWEESINRRDANPSLKYLNIDPSNYKMKQSFYKKQCEEFWMPYLNGNSTVMAMSGLTADSFKVLYK